MTQFTKGPGTVIPPRLTRLADTLLAGDAHAAAHGLIQEELAQILLGDGHAADHERLEVQDLEPPLAHEALRVEDEALPLDPDVAHPQGGRPAPAELAHEGGVCREHGPVDLAAQDALRPVLETDLQALRVVDVVGEQGGGIALEALRDGKGPHADEGWDAARAERGRAPVRQRILRDDGEGAREVRIVEPRHRAP